ncbi:MAG: YdcF family protein [Deltaproteobacteria bacterium]|nr:YdcF family protein [Deltaproteobacteria bacterium]
MIFLVAKFAEQWLAPAAAGCLLMALGLLLLTWRARTGRAIAAVGLALLWVLSTGAVSGRLLARLEGAYPVPPPSARADAVVLLAGVVDLARSTPEHVEFGEGVDRVLEAARLVRTGRARRLVISGGSGDPLRPKASEADLLARFAVEFGVPPGAILVQQRSRTTAEDARFTAPLIREKGIGRFFLVTSAYHMPRAVGCFKKLGLEPLPYPVDFQALPRRPDLSRYTPTVSGLRAATIAFHEYLGYGIYWLSGRVPR